MALAEIDGRPIAFVADDDDDDLHAVALDTREELSTTKLGGAPSQIMVAKTGRVLVALRDRARIDVLEVTSRDGAARVVRSVPTSADPVAMAISPDDATLLVTSGFTHTLAAYRFPNMGLAFDVSLAREPRGVVVSDDGHTAFVSHVVGSKMSVVDLARPPHDVRVVKLDSVKKLDPRAQEATAATPGDEEEGDVAPAERPRTACQGFALAKSDNPPGRILAPQVLVDSGDPQQQTSGYGDDGAATEVGSIAVIDASDGIALNASLRASSAASSVPSGAMDCVLPRAAATDAATRSLYVTCLGVDALVEYDAGAADPHAAERRRWSVGAGPTGVAVDAIRRRAYVWSQFDRVLDVLALDGARAEPPASLARVAVSRRAVTALADVALGRRLFHAAGDARISADGRACASCHPDGRDDALTWATPGGPRQSPMLAGRLATTAPYGWDGAGSDVKNHLTHTFERLRGEGVGQAGVDALAAYIVSMRAPDVPRAADPSVTRGAELFASAEAGCASCHTPSNGFVDGKKHEVGSAAQADTVKSFDTPSLRFVGGTAPYFHDGRYATLRELLVSSDGKMGHTRHLEQADLDALEAYLRTL